MQIRMIATRIVFVGLFALCASVFGGERGTPMRSHILRLEPDTGKAGDIIVAHGEQLDRSKVEELLLTNGECTALVTIVHQNEVSIHFRIPANLSSGRYTVVMQPAGRYSRGIEQRVTLTVQ